MAQSPIFNVSAATLKGRVQGLSISAATIPDITTVEDIILGAEALVIREAAVVGVVWGGTVQDETYNILRTMVIYKSLSEVMASRNRGGEEDAYYDTKYKELLGTLRHRPQSIKEVDAPQSVRVVTLGDARSQRYDLYSRFRRVINTRI
jgi:hypothetical protein